MIILVNVSNRSHMGTIFSIECYRRQSDAIAEGITVDWSDRAADGHGSETGAAGEGGFADGSDGVGDGYRSQKSAGSIKWILAYGSDHILSVIITNGFRYNDSPTTINETTSYHCCLICVIQVVVYAINLDIVGERYSRQYGQAYYSQESLFI